MKEKYTARNFNLLFSAYSRLLVGFIWEEELDVKDLGAMRNEWFSFG
jgi:hypothetical protein